MLFNHNKCKYLHIRQANGKEYGSMVDVQSQLNSVKHKTNNTVFIMYTFVTKRGDVGMCASREFIQTSVTNAFSIGVVESESRCTHALEAG